MARAVAPMLPLRLVSTSTKRMRASLAARRQVCGWCARISPRCPLPPGSSPGTMPRKLSASKARAACAMVPACLPCSTSPFARHAPPGALPCATSSASTPSRSDQEPQRLRLRRRPRRRDRHHRGAARQVPGPRHPRRGERRARRRRRRRLDEFEWIIDPLDGTTNYLHGFPQWAISIGLRRRGRMELAVVYDPLHEELFTAERGGGAKLNDRKIRVTQRRGIEGALIGTGIPFRDPADLEVYLPMLEAIIENTAGVRRPGSAALDFAYVAAGRLDGFWELGLRPGTSPPGCCWSPRPAVPCRTSPAASVTSTPATSSPAGSRCTAPCCNACTPSSGRSCRPSAAAPNCHEHARLLVVVVVVIDYPTTIRKPLAAASFAKLGRGSTSPSTPRHPQPRSTPHPYDQPDRRRRCPSPSPAPGAAVRSPPA
jgi:hypothetical protein